MFVLCLDGLFYLKNCFDFFGDTGPIMIYANNPDKLPILFFSENLGKIRIQGFAVYQPIFQ